MVGIAVRFCVLCDLMPVMGVAACLWQAYGLLFAMLGLPGMGLCIMMS